MNNVFDYGIMWNNLKDDEQILITKQHYRTPLSFFINGKVSSEKLRSLVYYMDQAMAFTTNSDLFDGSDSNNKPRDYKS